MGSSVSLQLPDGCVFGGRWEIVRCIRAGGMGAVYEVVHRETRARSALKVMLPDLMTSSELRERFRQEAMVTATIESDHVVKVFDGGTDAESGSPYLVMELLRGEDLGARISKNGAVPKEEAVALLAQVALALDKTHAAGVVHRDLKPENLFVTERDDGASCVKVLDFGIAKLVAQSISKAETTRTLGTPLYMAPEQVRGDGTIGPAADLLALAHIAYALLVGEPYWKKEKVAHESVYPLLMAITDGTKDPATARAAAAGVELPAAFDAWFSKATAALPEDRFTSAPELVRELARTLGVTPPQSIADKTPITDSPPVPAKPALGATRIGLGLAAIALVALGIGYGASVHAGDTPRRDATASAEPTADAAEPQGAAATDTPAPDAPTTAESAPATPSGTAGSTAEAKNAEPKPPTAPPRKPLPSAQPAPEPTAEPTSKPSAAPVDPSDTYRKGGS